MQYRLNENMQEMSLGEGEGTVYFDVISGNTHVMDDVAQDVLDAFKMESDFDKVIGILAAKYDEEKDVIQNDVAAFVELLLEKDILLCI